MDALEFCLAVHDNKESIRSQLGGFTLGHDNPYFIWT